MTLTFLLLLILASCGRDKGNTEDSPLPHLHFAAASNWTGEPTGLIYDEGAYHLFYQHNPEQPMLGNIGWGHAVSHDLLHWEVLPPAITPDQAGQIYPGSVISDTHNTSRLGSTTTPVWMAFYTYHQSDKATDSGQCVALAYSTDWGVSWTKHPTPVLTAAKGSRYHHPHVAWNERCGQWLMTVSTGSTLHLYASPDGLQWSFLSEFGSNIYSEGGWEGSDLFPLPLTDGREQKWVLLVNMSGGPAGGAPGIRYFVGDFDGKTFRPTQSQELWTDYGKDNYASAICPHIPTGRHLLISWMNSWDYANLTPAHTRRGSLTLPRELALVPEGNYYLLTSTPLRELKEYATATDSVGTLKLTEEEQPLFSSRSFPRMPFAIRLQFDNTARHAIWTASDYGLRLLTRTGRSLSIGYQADMNYYYIDRVGLTAQPFSDSFEQLTGAIYSTSMPVTEWYIVVDHGSVELFAGEGRIAITSLCYPDEPFEKFIVYARSGSATLLKAFITEIDTTN